MSATTEETIAELKEKIETLKGKDFDILLKIKAAGDAYNPAKIKSEKAAAEYKQALAKDSELIDEASNQYREALEAEKRIITSILETPILTLFKPEKLQQELQITSTALIEKLSKTDQAMQEIQARRPTMPLDAPPPNKNPTLFSHPSLPSKGSILHNKELDKEKSELDKAGKPEHKPPH